MHVIQRERADWIYFASFYKFFYSDSLKWKMERKVWFQTFRDTDVGAWVCIQWGPSLISKAVFISHESTTDRSEIWQR